MTIDSFYVLCVNGFFFLEFDFLSCAEFMHLMFTCWKCDNVCCSYCALSYEILSYFVKHKFVQISFVFSFFSVSCIEKHIVFVVAVLRSLLHLFSSIFPRKCLSIFLYHSFITIFFFIVYMSLFLCCLQLKVMCDVSRCFGTHH